jgi:hypothetical protein
MRNLSRAYMLAALSWLLAGMALGLWMGATDALQYRPLHLAMMMLGFVLLGMYGAIYRLWPRLQMARFAILQFWLSAVGVLLMNIGTLIQVFGGSIAVDAVGSVLVFGGAIVLFYLFLTNAVEPDPPRTQLG